MTELRVQKAASLRGEIRVPGDKSISHRAVMLAGMAEGETRLRGVLLAEDVKATCGAIAATGATVEIVGGEGEVKIRGTAGRDLRSPDHPLDLGNSGTSMRLLAGFFAGRPLNVVLVGDQSLSRRPMKRVIEPLRQMGAEIICSPEGTAPLEIKGRPLHGLRYEMPLASAQLKSALLLAGISAEGETWVREPLPSRDHTERMLPAFGVTLKKDGDWIGVTGPRELQSPGRLEVPGDFSSAAFFLVAALIVPDSEVVIRKVGVNPTRTGLLEILAAMGARIEVINRRRCGEEPVADLMVRTSQLQAVEAAGEIIPRLIDEIPALCVAAARAEGRTIIRDAAELRVKESDRIAGMAEILSRMGVRVEERADGLEIRGPAELHAAEIESRFDHRLAMAAAVAGLAAEGETVIGGAEFISTSFPDFPARLTELQR